VPHAQMREGHRRPRFGRPASNRWSPIPDALGPQRMYQLIRQEGPVADHLFEVGFLDPGAQVFAFTFD
jgi:thioredoxin family protein